MLQTESDATRSPGSELAVPPVSERKPNGACMVKLAQGILRKIIYAGAIAALLSGAASAQMPMPGINLNSSPRPLTPEEKEKQRLIENEYKSAIGKIPDQKKPVDAWGNIRSNPSASSKPKQGQ